MIDLSGKQLPEKQDIPSGIGPQAIHIMPGIVVEKINQKKDDGYYYFNEPGACL